MAKTGQFIKWGILATTIVILVFILVSFGRLVENVEADEIVIIQYPVSGELTFHTQPGWAFQKFGKATHYPKRGIYNFDGFVMNVGGGQEEGAKIRFNDGAEAAIQGSLQFDYPLDEDSLRNIHTLYGSAPAVQQQLIEVVTDKVLFMVGPLVSSKESYSERRTDLINWAEDQVNNGIYRTQSVEVEEIDSMTGEKRTVTRADILLDDDGNPKRQETAQLTAFGIIPRNFAVTGVVYPDVVRAQIATQQENIMAVETAIAEAKQAEQRTLTVEQQGKATAATEKWKQEALKAQAVTEAEQRLAVAELDQQTAGARKAEQILLGQGEAERKKLVMAADGALSIKIDAYKYAVDRWAQAIENYGGNWVPTIVMGSGDGAADAGSGATTLLELLGVKAAKDLALDLKPKQ